MTAASAGRGQGLSNGQEGVSFATRDWDAAERAGASMQPCCWLSTWYSHEWVAWAQQPNAIRPKGGFETNITSEQTGIMAGRLPDEACDRRAHLPPPPPPRPPPPPAPTAAATTHASKARHAFQGRRDHLACLAHHTAELPGIFPVLQATKQSSSGLKHIQPRTVLING